MAEPMVIWRKTVVHGEQSYLVRAVRREVPNLHPKTDPPTMEVRFEFLGGRASMDEPLWNGITVLPSNTMWIIQEAFILDASAYVAKDPILEQEP